MKLKKLILQDDPVVLAALEAFEADGDSAEVRLDVSPWRVVSR